MSDQFKDTEGSHDFHHISRVLELSRYLQLYEGGNKELIEASALLHDISDHKYNGGDSTLGGKEAFHLCLEFGSDEEFAKHVMEIVDSISYKGAGVLDKVNGIEAAIVRDADRLDAIGAIGIARAFAYGGSKNRPLHSDNQFELHQSFEAYKNAKSGTIHHFYEKLFLLKDRMQTVTAQKLASDRHELMLRYVDEFLKEWDFKPKSP